MGNAAAVLAASSSATMVRQPSLVWSEEDVDVDVDGDGDGEVSESESSSQESMTGTTADSSSKAAASQQQRLLEYDATKTTARLTASFDYDRCFLFSVPALCKSSRRPSILVIDSRSGNDDDEDQAELRHDDDGDSSDAAFDEWADSSSQTSYSPLSRCYPSTPSPGSASSSTHGSSSSTTTGGGLLLRYSSSYASLFDPLEYTPEEMELSSTTPTKASDLTRPNRPIFIVTTAALPWMTGTAINPLLRAKYLGARMTATATANGNSKVTLVVPWLESPEDRVALYGEEWRHKTVDDHASYLQHHWLHGSTVSLLFYPAKYHSQLSSIFALGDLCELLPTCEDGVCILEEPEHVNFYRAPGLRGWRQKFSHVIGIVHTNYKAYAQHHYSGLVTGPIVGVLSAWMVRAYCDKVIKLSSVLQEYAAEKECVENVHGIRPEFLDPTLPIVGNKVYFLGKLLWCKGLDKLLELEEAYRRATGSYFEIDVFGSGPEEAEIQRAFGQSSPLLTPAARSAEKVLPTYSWRRRPMPVTFPGRVDHAALGGDYKVFVNPSVTEVLCTSTAEAVARGRFVLVPRHPSNDFFAQFPNCLQYKTKADFCTLLQFALSHDPAPLSPELRHALTWEAATDRLVRAAAVSERDQARRDRVGLRLDERLAKWHYDWGRGKTGDVLRTVLGGGPVAAQTQYSSTSSLVSAASASSSSSSLA